jgi:anti-sigma regulatory factor (Ser/Thr protein kinase)
MARRLLADALGDEAAMLANPTDAQLVVSELVTNAVLHGAPPIVLRVVPDGVLRIEVCDTSPGVPAIPDEPRLDAPGGRGLQITESLSRDWGVEWRPEGKCVWAALA